MKKPSRFHLEHQHISSPEFIKAFSMISSDFLAKDMNTSITLSHSISRLNMSHVRRYLINLLNHYFYLKSDISMFNYFEKKISKQTILLFQLKRINSLRQDVRKFIDQKEN